MITNIECIRDDLSEEQKNNLVSKLVDTEFKFVQAVTFSKDCKRMVTNIGWVKVREPRPDHPQFDEHYLPIGFIGASSKNEGKYYAELVNTDEKFPENYHSRLRKIYLSG